MDNFNDRLRGCLYGLAVGDALGAAVEFKAPGSFPPVTGYRAGGPHGLNPGEWTDDTSMALALADSIAQAGWDLNDQAQRYLNWYRNGRYSVNGRCFDIGNQTRSALARFEMHHDAAKAGDPAESASGNGSIMRLAPVVIAYARHYPESLDVLLDRAEASSIPTHPSPICLSACRYFALVLAALADGVPREEVLDPSWPMLRRLGKLHPAVESVAQGSFRAKPPPAIRGGGYVVDSLEAALWAFHDARDFREAVLRAVNLGDDADTTGAVCGQLAGACWGESGIPSEWRSQLAEREVLELALAALKLVATADIAQKEGPIVLTSWEGATEAKAVPPPDRSYWIEPGRILAGCYPGDLDPAEQERKIGHLLDLGVRTFVDLTEADESLGGHDLAPYEETVERVASEKRVQADYIRFPVKDLDVPSVAVMGKILQEIFAAVERGIVYVHCLGGVGRTGTVAACWLLSRGNCSAADVFETLKELRKMDRVRGRHPAPEMDVQRAFVRRWAARHFRLSYGAITGDLPSKFDHMTVEQARFFASLIREFSEAEARAARQASGDFGEYNRLIQGAYACGFVCRDICAPDFSFRFPDLVAQPDELRSAEFVIVRSFVHTMIRGIRHEMCAFEDTYIGRALRSGALEVIATRLESGIDVEDE